jgi:NTE family protein
VYVRPFEPKRGPTAGALRSVRARRAKPPSLSLALQGGGAFGAFTWGVLDRLLEAGVAVDAASGASAGAVNAVLLADGLAEGGAKHGAEAARARLDRFWNEVGHAGRLGRTGAALAALGGPAMLISPYHANPLGLNPLRHMLEDCVDFARLRAVRPIRLLLAATRVRDGALRIFREDEVSVDAVLASACLPHLHHAVEIDGEAYWDGGYSANPPLRQLVFEGTARDILLVEILPARSDEPPRLSGEIARRIAEIAFASPLRRELEGLRDLRGMAGKALPLGARLARRLQRLALHRIAAADSVPDLASRDPADTGLSGLLELREAGRAAAGRWLGSIAGG